MRVVLFKGCRQRCIAWRPTATGAKRFLRPPAPNRASSKSHALKIQSLSDGRSPAENHCGLAPQAGWTWELLYASLVRDRLTAPTTVGGASFARWCSSAVQERREPNAPRRAGPKAVMCRRWRFAPIGRSTAKLHRSSVTTLCLRRFRQESSSFQVMEYRIILPTRHANLAFRSGISGSERRENGQIPRAAGDILNLVISPEYI